ncbi:hypothetical protein BBK36DRAFT_1167201 [Trichoderma citrinoviride]|uniref:Uncharacterized protein n=1 Tax=Trichoderma citrinoviride TaxID=58853 RepID=A0A2T4BEY9_9HYPO|nr:hypothetical protein BBK36DRAFT_1167201 [Trichoderma citrinoviride]PTB67902.1 hypothetical protein BBK36DRAFT_1167201 [Trichoderma citrinoviride]
MTVHLQIHPSSYLSKSSLALEIPSSALAGRGRRQRLNLVQEHESKSTAVLPHPGAPASAPTTGCQRQKHVYPSDQVYFPLTPDHKLLYVIVLNVSRAVITNYFILCSITPIAASMCDSRRVFALSDLALAPQNLDGTPAIPPSFTPTELQQVVPHPGWIDLLPSPQLRDNLILAIEEFNVDEEDLLADLIGDIFEAIGCVYDDESTSSSSSGSEDGKEVGERPLGLTPEQEYTLRTYTPPCAAETGILSWSDPWEITGWEFTEKFITKWGFLLQGCPDVVAAANNWRVLRGEDPLVVEL